MRALLDVELEGNIAECSASRSFRTQERGNDRSSDTKLWQDEAVLDDTFSFHIRQFVATVRQRDFSKCWPFRQRILDKCLSVGLKPFLPPLESLQKECDGKVCDYGLQQISSSGEDKVLCEVEDAKDSNNAEKENWAVVLNDTMLAGTGRDEKGNVHETNTLEDSKNNTDAHVDEFPAIMPGEEIGVAISKQSQDNAPQSSTSMNIHNMDQSDSGIESDCKQNPKQSVSLLADKTHLLTMKDADFHSSNGSEVDIVSTVDTEHDFNRAEGGLFRSIQELHEPNFNPQSDKLTACEGKGHPSRSKLSGVESPEKVLQDGTQSLQERQADFDLAAVSCNTVGFPPRLERNWKNGDESSFTGLNLDALVPQVCPVCLNFTSTSNTALNAHIDHCLESVLPGEKGDSNSNKHRIKPRKMRSMVDICATAPTRTLEDLERSSKLWALDDETPKESCCSPTWNRGLVRRQPRTSLHRGFAWKARFGLEMDDARRCSASETIQQLAKSQQEVVAKQHELIDWIEDTAATLKSCEDQLLNSERFSGTLHVASSVTCTDQITHEKKKKKRISRNFGSSKEVTGAEGSKLSPDLLGFTIIDTSKEEEQRLLQKTKCVNDKGNDTGDFSGEVFVDDIQSQSEKVFKRQYSKSSPFSGVTSKKWGQKTSHKIVRKRLRTWAENKTFLSDEETSSEDDFELFADKPVRTKKAAPKIKSLLTVVANSCKDKEREATEGLESQKITPAQENVTISGFNLPESGGLSKCQEDRSKCRNIKKTPDEQTEVFCETSKQPCVFPEEPACLGDHYLYRLSKYGKSSEQISVSSGRMELPEEELYPDCQQQEFLQCSSIEHVDRDLHVEGFGSRASLMSTHQAECSHASERRANVIKVASSKDILIKAPLCSADILNLRATGLSSCRSEYDCTTKASSSPPLIKAHAQNREDVSSLTCKGVVQSSQTCSCISQHLLASSSGGSCCPLATYNSSTEIDSIRGLQMLPALQKTCISGNMANCQPLNSLRNKQLFQNGPAAFNCPLSITRDCEGSQTKIGPQLIESAQLKDSGIRILKDSGKHLAVAECMEDFGQCRLNCSVQQGAEQSMGSCDLYETSGLKSIGNQLNGDNGNHFVANKLGQSEGHHVLSENMQRVANCTLTPMAPHHHQQIYVGSNFLSSNFSPVILSPNSEFVQDNRHFSSCDRNDHYYAPRSATTAERTCLPSRVIADFACSLATDSVKMQETMQRNCCFPEERIMQASYNGAMRNSARGNEYGDFCSLQSTGKFCAPPIGSASVQPQVPHTTVHSMASTSVDCMNCVGRSATVSWETHNSLLSGPHSRADPPRTYMNGTRESFLGAELASSLGNHGSVEYPADQTVVHIFGNPVFKLMGQNVIVTSNSIKALSSSDRNGVQHFHSSDPIMHLGVLPERQNHYAHDLSPEMFTCTRLEGWPGDRTRNHLFKTDNMDIPVQTLQNLPPTKSVHVKMLTHKDPLSFEPRRPICILDKELQSLRQTQESVIKKPALVSPGTNLCTEGFCGSSRGASNSLPASLSKCGGIALQQRRDLSATYCRLPQYEQGKCPFPLQSVPVTYLDDIHKLDVSSCYRSGTLADIVQSSERSNS